MSVSHNHRQLYTPEYIPIAPWEEIAKVGMMKESSYQEGVNKVQQQIDSLSQLPIYRNVAKDYLNQRVQDFTNLANKYAGEDFSNPDVSSQILRMGDPIAKDPLLINEIRSTQEVSRRQELLKSLKPEQRSAANDWFFMRDMNEWMNSNDLSASLSQGKEYVSYVDVSKQWQDYVKAKTPNSQTLISASVNNPFIKTTQIEEMAAEELAKGFMATLDEKGRTQLSIDAAYSMELSGKENGFKAYQNHIDGQLSFLDQQEKYYNEELKYLNKQPKAELTRIETSQLEQKLNEISIQKRYLAGEKNIALDDFTVENYTQFYVQRMVNDQANAYAYRRVKEDLKVNSVYTANMQIQASQRMQDQRLRQQKQLVDREFYNNLTVKERADFAPTPGFKTEDVMGYIQIISNGITKGTLKPQKGYESMLAQGLADYNKGLSTGDNVTAIKGLQKVVKAGKNINGLSNDELGLVNKFNDLNEKNVLTSNLDQLLKMYNAANSYKNDPNVQVIYTNEYGVSEVAPTSAKDFMNTRFENFMQMPGVYQFYVKDKAITKPYTLRISDVTGMAETGLVSAENADELIKGIIVGDESISDPSFLEEKISPPVATTKKPEDK